MNHQFFISGISTEIGKTMISAIFVKALEAFYWKPVQSGELHYSDSMKISELAEAPASKILPEKYRLNFPLSPHASAAIDGKMIQLTDFTLPSPDGHLIVEGAGGLMVTLNQEELLIDLIQDLQIPVVLVSQYYLGSINHTLLSIEALENRGIPIAGIVFNGEKNQASMDFILHRHPLPVLLEVNQEETFNRITVAHYAAKLKQNLIDLRMLKQEEE